MSIIQPKFTIQSPTSPTLRESSQRKQMDTEILSPPQEQFCPSGVLSTPQQLDQAKTSPALVKSSDSEPSPVSPKAIRFEEPVPGTAPGVAGTLMMTEHPPALEKPSSVDGFLARLVEGGKTGVESSGTVLKRAMVDSAEFGNRVGKALGCDETAPGLRGAVGTSLSLGVTLVGGIAAMPLAFVVGAADALSS